MWALTSGKGGPCGLVLSNGESIHGVEMEVGHLSQKSRLYSALWEWGTCHALRVFSQERWMPEQVEVRAE